MGAGRPAVVTDLVVFLRARLDEDEQVARATVEAPWIVPAYDPTVVKPYGSDGLIVRASGPGAAEHIALHDPARVLAEVDAKRRIVALCEPSLVEVTAYGQTEREFIPGNGPPWGDGVLRLLAAPYADHPDYDPAWRPE
jgi:hypothetical protein